MRLNCMSNSAWNTLIQFPLGTHIEVISSVVNAFCFTSLILSTPASYSKMMNEIHAKVSLICKYVFMNRFARLNVALLK